MRLFVLAIYTASMYIYNCVNSKNSHKWNGRVHQLLARRKVLQQPRDEQSRDEWELHAQPFWLYGDGNVAQKFKVKVNGLLMYGQVHIVEAKKRWTGSKGSSSL